MTDPEPEKLVIGRNYFEPFREDSPLPLQSGVVGPFDEACEIAFGLDVLSNTKILRLFLK